MKRILATLCALYLVFALSPLSLAQSAIPEELIGSWTGTGSPPGKGSPIDLSFTIAEDGTGEYRFMQGGYTESYPFALQSETAAFTVSVPQNNALGIASVSGTYALADGVMTLAIVTHFQNGGTYEYTAACTRQQTAAQAALPTFPWEDKPIRIALITEDESVIDYKPSVGEDPLGADGRFIKLLFAADEKTLTADEMKSLGNSATLRAANGTQYTSTLYTNIRLHIKNGKISLSDEQPGFGMLFVVPKTVALESLMLDVPAAGVSYSLQAYGEDAYRPETTAAPQ